MPTYEYACRDCGEHLEVVQKFADPPLTDCPACDGALRKVFGAVGIVLKGSGFYKTDSRGTNAKTKAKGKEAESASRPATESSGSSSAGAETSGSGSGSSASGSSGSGRASSSSASSSPAAAAS